MDYGRLLPLLHTELCIAKGAYDQRRHSADARALRTNLIRAKLRWRFYFRAAEAAGY